VRGFWRWAAFVGFVALIGAVGAYATHKIRLRIEANLSQAIQMPVRIHRMTFRPRGIVLHRVGIQFPNLKGSMDHPPIVAERIQVEGSLWAIFRYGLFPSRPDPKAFSNIAVRELKLSFAGFPMVAQGNLHLGRVLLGQVEVEGWMSFRHPLLNGYLEATGPVTAPVLLGWFDGLPSGRTHFLAQLRLTHHGVELSHLELPRGWRAVGRMDVLTPPKTPSSTRWQGQLDLVGPKDRFRLEVEPKDKRTIRMSLSMHREGLPVNRMEGEVRMTRQALHLQLTFFDASVRLEGQIASEPPYPIRMVAILDQMELERLAQWFPDRMGGVKVSGRVSGQVELSGSWPHMESRGELLAEEGRFNQQRIAKMVVRFHGNGPLVTIEPSLMVKPDGSFRMEGQVDLRRMGQSDFFRAIRLSPSTRDFSWAGWQIRPTSGWQGEDDGIQMVRARGIQGSEEAMELSIRVNRDERFVGMEKRKRF